MILLLNDTSRYHYGCQKVIESFEFDRSIKTNESPKVVFSEYSKVILNGEGTLHHDQKNADKFLRYLARAQEAGCETEIRNTVWQSMSPKYKEILSNCDKITVREVLSQQELSKIGIEAEVELDRSLIPEVSYFPYEHVEVYEGQYFYNKSSESIYPRIDIFKQDWDEMVNRLRNADVLITGRHHEMYAAIKARCRFIVIEGNTWKNRGLFETCGAKPIMSKSLLPKVLSGEFDEEYDKIWKFVEAK